MGENDPSDTACEHPIVRVIDGDRTGSLGPIGLLLGKENPQSMVETLRGPDSRTQFRENVVQQWPCELGELADERKGDPVWTRRRVPRALNRTSDVCHGGGRDVRRPEPPGIALEVPGRLNSGFTSAPRLPPKPFKELGHSQGVEVVLPSPSSSARRELR